MRPRHPAFRAAVCCGAALLVAACAKKEVPPADTIAAVEAPTTATAGGAVSTPIVLSEVAGSWKFRATPQSATDTAITTYTLTTTGTTEGWKLTFPNGQVVPQRVTVSGDSVVLEAGPYSSIRRKGVQVTTNSVVRRQGDKLVGTTVAHYRTKGADSVLTLTTEGVRAP